MGYNHKAKSRSDLSYLYYFFVILFTSCAMVMFDLKDTCYKNITKKIYG